MTSNSSKFSIFSSYEKSTFQRHYKDVQRTANYFNSLYEKHKDTLTDEELSKKMTDYFHSLYNLFPDLAYNLCFKMRSDIFKIIDQESLPQAIQTDLKNRSQKLMNDYNNHIKNRN